MDNVTHSLAGFLIAETYLNLKKEPPSQKTRKIIHLASFIANNFPDLDFIYAGFFGSKIGYLLHHRGHTHTLLGAIPLILLVWLVISMLFKLKKPFWGLGGVIASGFLAHISLDFLNSYGVHPFWPWDNHWYYGDILFILEPWLWVFVLPIVGFSTLPKGFRFSAWILLIGILAFGMKVDLVSRSLILLLIFVSLFYSGIIRKISDSRRIFLGDVLFVTVILIFGTQSWRAKEIVLKNGNENIEDVVLSPLPANPFCWNLLLVEVSKGNYSVKRALVSTLTSIPVSDCPQASLGEGWAPRRKILWNQGNQIYWVDEYRTPISELNNARKLSCVSDSFFHFARVPYLSTVAGNLVIGDLRFDWDKRRGQFSSIFPTLQTAPCVKGLNQWEVSTDYLRNEKF
jgi:inner membrane protein